MKKASLPNGWQAGDKEAFEWLYQQHHGLVLKTAYLITANREEAEDVLQEVFVSVWKSRDTFDPSKSKFTTWLHRITINQCAKTHRRKQPAIQSLDKVQEQGSFMTETNSAQLPDQIAIQNSDYEDLMNTLSLLDYKHRSVMVLRYFNDQSYDEIAQTLEVPLGTVKSRINQALKSIRNQMVVLGKEGETDEM